MTGDSNYWNIAKYLRNIANSSMRQAKREFILQELKENENNCKKFWKTIREVIPNDKSSPKQDILLKHEGRKIDKGETASYINDYFINVGNSELRYEEEAEINRHDGSGGELDEGDTINNIGENSILSFTDVTETEVYRVVRDINVSKSSGLTNISSFIIKEAFGMLIPEVAYMYNLSLKSSNFPDPWKSATVIPIPKSGDLTQVKNYRPISLLPIPGKILEKLVHVQLSNHLEVNELLTPVQHGFRKAHSTAHSIVQLTEFINLRMDQRMPTLVTYIDFRKAFDCVQHPVLLGKLRQLGLGQPVIEWVRSYLRNRDQKVLANGVLSTTQTITQGVPQGSVLGPLLYIVYANDLIKTIKHCKVALYADDTVLFTANDRFETSVRLMQQDINALSGWCCSNGIKANTDKTKVMVFGSPNCLKGVPDFNLVFEDTPLHQVQSYKYLGMTLDNQLNYNLHVTKVIASVSGKLKQFHRMRSFLNTRAALLVYKSMMLPILEYGDILFSAASLGNRKKLQVLQNKGLRCALNKGLETSSDDLHREANLLKLKFRREQHVLNFVYDWSLDSARLKTKAKEGVITRSHSKKLLKIRRPITEKYKNCLSYKGAKKWNALPSHVHQIVDKSGYKKEIESWVSNKARVACDAKSRQTSLI